MKFQTPKGTRDYMPEEASKLQKVLDVVRSVFERYGFAPLFTPAFEDFSLLSAKGGLGEAVKDEIYYFKDKGDRELGLRFDLTMPLVRVAASNPQLPKPFKRYAIGCVWRYDNPQAMRYREFWQADVDVVGSSSVVADVECLAAVCECLERLGFQDFFIRINNRKIVQAVFEKIGVKNLADALRSIDKLEKIGEDGVRSELESKGVESATVTKILKFLETSGRNSAIVEKIKEEYGDMAGIAEIEELLDFATEFGIDKRLKLDLSIVRGLDYYTGPVFEIELGEGLSCGGGGRYDNLVKDVGGTSIPATGISLGISRIFEVMKNKNMFDALPKTTISVFVANTDKKLLPEAVKLARRIRNKVECASCQTDSMERNLTKQLEYANSVGMDYVIIVGEKEPKEGKYTLKDMKMKVEDKLQISEIIRTLNEKSRRLLNFP